MTSHRVTLNGRNWSQGITPPQPDAQRLHVHGPLEPLDYEPRRDVITMLIASLALIAAVVLAAIAMGWL